MEIELMELDHLLVLTNLIIKLSRYLLVQCRQQKSFNEETILFQALRESVNVTLEKHTPTKKRYARANQAPYMNKKLSKEIMKRSCLRNKFLNTISDLYRKEYNKQ